MSTSSDETLQFLCKFITGNGSFVHYGDPMAISTYSATMKNPFIFAGILILTILYFGGFQGLLIKLLPNKISKEMFCLGHQLFILGAMCHQMFYILWRFTPLSRMSLWQNLFSYFFAIVGLHLLATYLPIMIISKVRIPRDKRPGVIENLFYFLISTLFSIFLIQIILDDHYPICNSRFITDYFMTLTMLVLLTFGELFVAKLWYTTTVTDHLFIMEKFRIVGDLYKKGGKWMVMYHHEEDKSHEMEVLTI